MWCPRVILTLGLVVYVPSSLALWSCHQDSDCSSLSGSICNTNTGDCICPPGQQSVLGGTVCVDLAPYHTSTCVENHQCFRMFASFECRHVGVDTETGSCSCQQDHHYFLGRCWSTIPYGETCSRDEECLSILRDPYSLSCNETCRCAEGYYERQRGECRRISSAIGEGCVLDEDCQFANGACDITVVPFRCYDTTTSETPPQPSSSSQSIISTSVTRQHGIACSNDNPCQAPFECSIFGSCICPVGYYASPDGSRCLAELGSPVEDANECVGLFTEVRNGICTCWTNFYFGEDMRDCIKASRTITDSCVVDANCHTFGAAARCGAPQESWFLRNCECDPEQSVWDAGLQMCRLFAGVGESCEVDSDCLAGELEINCLLNVCTCPEGYTELNGLCLTFGLALGDDCQATEECTETANMVCTNGRCSCDATGYQEVDGVCAPIIGGACAQNSDCVIDNTVCHNDSNEWTCQCESQFVEYEDTCWAAIPGIDASCEVTAQCTDALGDTSICDEGRCVCIDGHHFRGNGCWPITGLFEVCSRTSQCYLGERSSMVVCRNSLCQCDFQFPYSEELHTCTGNGFESSSSHYVGSVFLITTAMIYLFIC